MTSEDARIAWDLLQRRVAHAEAEVQRLRERPEPERGPVADTGNGHGQLLRLAERLARLETRMGGFRHFQSVIVSLAFVLFAFLIGLGIYNLQRVDLQGQRLDDLGNQVAALPSKMTDELQNLIRTFAESVAATKRAPEVIVLPASKTPAASPNR